MAKDYYRILGVARDASTAEIKSAFRRLARETHPDANPDNPEAEARFRDAAEAYEVLSNPERRQRYDRGDTIDLGDLFGGFGGFDDILRSVFGDSGLFGSSGAATRPRRGTDLLVRVRVSLEQAAFGCDVDVTYATTFACEICGGSGATGVGASSTCSTCGGAGAVRMARRSIVGTMMTVVECPDCAGQGSVVTDPCAACSGSGTSFGERTMTVEIPAGVSTGTRLRLSGRGEAVGRGGRPGDLQVEVHVEPDPRFERDDIDLYHHLDISAVEATLGTKREVPLLESGTETLEIPAGTQPGTLLRMPGFGVPRLGRKGRGDLIIRVGVSIPTDISEEERTLLMDLGRLRGDITADPASTDS
ncbi:MAG TPA: molecular chaperone DnaJ [Acidimicrobiia bacterium]|nr:molecular chaperone DnaJ [Acidimicrobiia bacterium]